jgi:hypothetical protein
MVNAPVLLRILYRHDIPDILHDTDDTHVAGVVAADITNIGIRNIMAYQAVLHFIFQPCDRIAEPVYLFRLFFEQVQYEPQRCFFSDAGQFSKFSHGILQ